MKRILMYIITTIALLTIGCSDFDTSGNDINPLSGQTAAPEDITSFTFSTSTSTVIDESTGTITVTVPFGTSVTALVATFTTGGGTVKIGSTDQVSGTTANDFTSSKTYTVTGPDGTTKVYTVTVTVALASSKAITAFSFTSPAATGVITGTNIAVTVPFGTNVTALAATFSTDGGSVKVGSTVQTSGSTTNNFTSPVTYIVTAANGSTQNYIVTVTLASAQAVTFSTLTANGSSGTVTTTTLTLTFSDDPTTLAASDITVTGATKGALSVSGATRTLAITDITVANGATVSVTVASPSGFVITGSPKTVAVYTVPQNTSIFGVATKSTLSNAVAIDASGNRYVTGNSNGALDGQTLTGTQDVFVIKYNSSGVKQWTRLLGVSTKITAGYGIAVDSSGNSYVTGNTNGALSGETLTGTNDVFVIKYDTNGLLKWTRLLGTAVKNSLSYGIAVDSSGNSFATGYIDGPTLDGQTITGASQCAFVIKYDIDGVKLWTKLIGAASKVTYGYAITVNSTGEIFATGGTEHYTLNGETATNTSGFSAYVVKYDTTGNVGLTCLSGAGGSFTISNGIKVDSSGNIFISGRTNMAFDGHTMIGTQDIFVKKFNSTGTAQWTSFLGTAATMTQSSGIVLDLSSNCYVTGHTPSSTLNGTIAANPGGSNSYITKYNSAGVHQSTSLLGVGATKHIRSAGISIDSSANTFITGFTTAGFDGQTLTGNQDGFITKLP